MKSIKKNVIRELIPFAKGTIHAIYYPDTDETVIKFIKNK